MSTCHQLFSKQAVLRVQICAVVMRKLRICRRYLIFFTFWKLYLYPFSLLTNKILALGKSRSRWI